MKSLQQPVRSNIFDRWWVVVIAFVLIRFVVLIITTDTFVDDPDNYWGLAKSWYTTGTFGLLNADQVAIPTAFRPPLYPWLLSWFANSEVINKPALIAIHLGLGTATCFLCWSIAKVLLRSGQTPTVGNPSFNTIGPWLVGLCVAIDPILVRQSTLIMTETLATMLATLVWWTWIHLEVRGKLWRIYSGLAIGSLMGLFCLTRSSGLVWFSLLIPLTFVSCIKLCPTETRPNQIGFVLFLVLGGMLVLTPWSIRNRVLMGKAIWTTTHGGYTLLLANNPILFDHYEEVNLSRDWNEAGFHEWWAKKSVDAGFITELEHDRHANSLAWQTIQERPRGFAVACVARFGWFWAWWPSHVDSTPRFTIVMIGAWYGFTTLLFVVAAFCSLGSFRKIFNPQWLPAIALVLGISGVHMVYWSNMRMRAPLIPVVYVASVSFATRFVNRPRRS
jgi:hypothetical protein